MNTFNSEVSYNSFWDNQLDPYYTELAGGVIVDTACSVNEVITNNFIDNSNVGTAGATGMELYGINMVVENNTVQNMGGPGMSLNAACGVGILGNTIQNTTRNESGPSQSPNNNPDAQFNGGLTLQNQGVPSTRATQEISVSYLTSTNNYSGVAFFAGSQPNGTNGAGFANVFVNTNCLQPNGLGGQTYTVYNQPLPGGIFIFPSTNAMCPLPTNPSLPPAPSCLTSVYNPNQ